MVISVLAELFLYGREFCINREQAPSQHINLLVAKPATMASDIASANKEAVVLAIRELSLPRDQEGLANFLTDYFGSAEPPEELGRHVNKLIVKNS